jgi:hypothetical protein
MTATAITDAIDTRLAGTGLFVRGGSHPNPDDAVPPRADGQPARTVVLVGNAGGDLWRAFTADNPAMTGDHPLDRWVDGHLERAAAAVGAEVVFPTRRPYPPIMRWAKRAGPVHSAPINLLIHPDYGLWHVYRGAFLFADRLALPAAPTAASPCDTCAKKPCLRACPADAFQPDHFDPVACVSHVESPAGANCAERGCLARRACPVGRDYAYPPAAGAYHMGAVIRTVRRRIDRGMPGAHPGADAPPEAGKVPGTDPGA